MVSNLPAINKNTNVLIKQGELPGFNLLDIRVNPLCLIGLRHAMRSKECEIFLLIMRASFLPHPIRFPWDTLVARVRSPILL